MTTPIDTHHLRSLLAELQPHDALPWVARPSVPGPISDWSIQAASGYDLATVYQASGDTARLIAAAVNALPELLDELDAKEAELSRRDKDIALLVAANDAKLSLLRQQERELNERDESARESRERTDAELARLREERGLMARWIVGRSRRDAPGVGDHACARCVPGGPLVSGGFVCARHLAEDIERDDALAAGKGGE